MRYFGALTLVLFSLIPAALTNPAPQNPNSFNTNSKFAVDSTAMSLSSAVAIVEPRRGVPGYSWLRIHFYPFPLTPEDIAGAKLGNVDSMDKKSNKNSFDPHVRNSSHAEIQLSVDKDFKVWQVDMAIPGHGCTIAPFEKDVQSFLQTYRYDGKTLRLKSKGSHLCDFKMLKMPAQNFTWDLDLTLPVYNKPTLQ